MPRTPRIKPYTPKEAFDILAAYYGPRPWYSRNPPMRELVITILAQHTSDTNAERAFALLWERYGSWQAIADADVEEIADTIRTGGLAQQKAPRIKGVLQEVYRRRGDYELGFLLDLGFDRALEFLTTLNGIGPKTARCVLVFSLGIPAVPVDTHVHRVAKRLGLIPPTLAADPAHKVIEAMYGPEERYPFHVYLIEHGRGLCRAIGPRCAECPLQERCLASTTHQPLKRKRTAKPKADAAKQPARRRSAATTSETAAG